MFFKKNHNLHNDNSTNILKFFVFQLSSVCFGGPDYRELFIASSYAGLTQDELTKQINAGHIFHAKGFQDLQGPRATPINLQLVQEE